MRKVFSINCTTRFAFQNTVLYKTKIINYANLLPLTESILGITMYELIKLGGQITVNSNTDDMNGYRIATQNSSLSAI